MDLKDLEQAISEQIFDLKTISEIPTDTVSYELITFDYYEKDNSKWLELIEERLKSAKTFEIHCWNEEAGEIALALQYGKLKDSDWEHGKIIAGKVTPSFSEMLLNYPKPTDTEIYNKMTPFFNVFLDDIFQSCHYGTENYIR